MSERVPKHEDRMDTRRRTAMARAVAIYLRETGLVPDIRIRFPLSAFQDAERFLITVREEYAAGAVSMRTPVSGSQAANSMLATLAFMKVFPEPVRQDGRLFALTMETYLKHVRMLMERRALAQLPSEHLFGMYVFFSELWEAGERLLDREKHSSVPPPPR